MLQFEPNRRVDFENVSNWPLVFRHGDAHALCLSFLYPSMH